jgi:hypothetical protein
MLPLKLTACCWCAQGVLSPADDVRLASLQGLGCVQSLEPFSIDLVAKLWVLSYDGVAEVAAAAQELWGRTRLELDAATFLPPLLKLLAHKEQNVRVSTGLALAAALEKFPHTIAPTVAQLTALFVASPDEVIENKMNIREEKKYISRWETRSGVALALNACVPVIVRCHTPFPPLPLNDQVFC